MVPNQPDRPKPANPTTTNYIPTLTSPARTCPQPKSTVLCVHWPPRKPSCHGTGSSAPGPWSARTSRQQEKPSREERGRERWIVYPRTRGWWVRARAGCARRTRARGNAIVGVSGLATGTWYGGAAWVRCARATCARWLHTLVGRWLGEERRRGSGGGGGVCCHGPMYATSRAPTHNLASSPLSLTRATLSHFNPSPATHHSLPHSPTHWLPRRLAGWRERECGREVEWRVERPARGSDNREEGGGVRHKEAVGSMGAVVSGFVGG